MDFNKAAAAALCLIGAAFSYSLADGPWDPSRLATVKGVVADYREVPSRRRSCFVIKMDNIKESFELCSSSYSNFNQAAFEREVRKGTRLEMQVVDEIKLNKTTDETKYWVQDIRTPDGRVYLDLEEIQKSRKQERTFAILLALGLVGGAFWNIRKALAK